MMTAFSSGVSGLKAQQTSLDVIANNISNVNTTGYKAQRVSFSDLLSQTISAATGSTATKGGSNAVQIGTGVSVGSIDTIMTVGSSQSTGVSTDLSIGGEGFFVVQGGSQGKYQYTRAGNLSTDSTGNVTVDGNEVCGWDTYSSIDADGNYVYNTDAEPTPINIYEGKKIIAAKATATADFTGNLDPTKTVATTATALNAIGTTPTTFDQTSSITVYDAQGNASDVTVGWKKCAVDSATNTTSWYWQASSADASITPSSGYVKFDSDGKIVTTDSTDYNTTPSIAVTSTGSGTDPFTVALNFADLGTYTSSSTSSVTGSADGYESGELQSVAISSDGTITGTYSNDQTQSLAKIALAVFNNASGLEKIGSNLYVASVNSGDAKVVTAGSGGSGTLSSGTLEMSNVDLAEQFSAMMITQRAYQANSKVISTADEMMQSLINMKS